MDPPTTKHYLDYQREPKAVITSIVGWNLNLTIFGIPSFGSFLLLSSEVASCVRNDPASRNPCQSDIPEAPHLRASLFNGGSLLSFVDLSDIPNFFSESLTPKMESD